MASQIVFGTYELLEAVILQMSPDTVIVATAVCPFWCNVITGSKLISEKLQNDMDLESNLPLHSVLLDSFYPDTTVCNVSPWSPWLCCTHLSVGTLFTARRGRVEIFTFLPSDQGQRFKLLTRRRRTIRYDSRYRIWTLRWLDERGEVVVERTCGPFSMGASALFEYMETFYAT